MLKIAKKIPWLKIGSGLVFTVILGVILIIALARVSSVTKLPYGFRFYVISTGSMFPTIKPLDVIITKPGTTYKEGDIVTFNNTEAKDSKVTNLTTHRIVRVVEEEGKTQYYTRGDANPADDQAAKEAGQIIGKVIVILPYIGRIVSFAQTQIGFMFLFVVPATIIVYREFESLKAEVTKSIADYKAKRANKAQEVAFEKIEFVQVEIKAEEKQEDKVEKEKPKVKKPKEKTIKDKAKVVKRKVTKKTKKDE